MDAVLEMAERCGLSVIEDAAQAVLARHRGRPVGGLGTLGAFSLHPLKTLGACGDGGVVTTNDEGSAQHLQRLRNHGLANRDECLEWGYNSRLDTIQAALLLEKLNHVEDWTTQRRRNAESYQLALADLQGIRLPADGEDEFAVYHTFVILADRRAERTFGRSRRGFRDPLPCADPSTGGRVETRPQEGRFPSGGKPSGPNVEPAGASWTARRGHPLCCGCDPRVLQRLMRIPFSYLGQQFADIDEYLEDIRALVGRSDFTLGAKTTEFEDRFAAFCGLPHAVGVGSGTDALIISLRLCGVRPGDEVITAANTFIATVGAIAAVGANPVLVDNEDGFTIDPAKIEAKITERTKAILPVHYSGNVADMPKIQEIADRHQLVVIEDAAQSIGASLNGEPVGSWGRTACSAYTRLRTSMCGVTAV